MANEKRGDYSEAVVAASLRAIPFFHRKLTTYHAVLPGCGVCVSDIIWGPLDNPSAVIQITSSGYQGNFQQKFWRDAGELFEVKKNFPTARLIQVLFKDGTREKLVGIQKQIWDGVVEVPKLRLGNTLMDEIDYASENEPRPNFEARIKHVMASFSEESVKELGEAIRVILNGRNDKVWSIRFKKERSAEKSEPRQINIRNAVLDAIILSYPKTEGGAIAKQLSLFSNGKTPTIGKLGWSGDKINILDVFHNPYINNVPYVRRGHTAHADLPYILFHAPCVSGLPCAFKELIADGSIK